MQEMDGAIGKERRSSMLVQIWKASSKTANTRRIQGCLVLLNNIVLVEDAVKRGEKEIGDQGIFT